MNDINRRLFANPLFWVDKQCALERALADGTVLEMNRPHALAELGQAQAKVRTFIAAGKITRAEVDAEIALQKEGQ